MKTFKQKFAPASMSMLAIVMCAVMIVAPIGCAKVLQTLNTVLSKEPAVLAIIHTAIDLVAIVDPTAVDPTLKATIDGLATSVTRDIQTLNAMITTYQADIGSAPPGVLSQVNALYGSIDGNLAALQNAFGLKSDRAKAEAAAIVDGVDIFLAELANFLPPPAAATVSAGVVAKAAIKTSAVLTGTSGKVKVISVKTYVGNFNKASAANFPQIQVAVPK